MLRDDLQWHIAARPSDIAKLTQGRAKARVHKTEHDKANVRAKVQHPFCVINRQCVGLSRESYRQPPEETEMNQALTAKIIEIANVRRRFAYRRIHDLRRPAFEA